MLFLNKTAKKILKYLNKDSIEITNQGIADKLKQEVSIIDENLEYLLDLSLIKIKEEHIGYKFYSSTIKGKCYFKDKLILLIKAFINSFVFPILISFITTLIALQLSK